MPDPNYADISIVLDRSGSMDDIKEDTIGGFNRFLEDQKNTPGRCALTLCQFDNEYEIVHCGKSIAEVPPLNHLTYVPRGTTALLDAIGRTINSSGARFSAMQENDRPGKVIFVILTDGLENSSQEFTRDQVMSMIKEQTEKWQWQFVYLGANQDAIAEGEKIGVQAAHSMKYSATRLGTQRLYRAASSNIVGFRMGMTADVAWTDEQRKEQEEAKEEQSS